MKYSTPDFHGRFLLLLLACGVLLRAPVASAQQSQPPPPPPSSASYINIGGQAYPTEVPALDAAIKKISELTHKHQYVDRALDVSPPPKPGGSRSKAPEPSMGKLVAEVKRHLSQLESTGAQITSQTKFASVVEELKATFKFGLVVKNAMILAFYLKQLPTFISLAVKGMDEGHLVHLLTVFQRNDPASPSMSEGCGSSEPRAILENYVPDDILRMFTDKVSELMAKAGVKLSPLITQVAQVLYRLGANSELAKYLGLLQGQVATLMKSFIDNVPNEGAQSLGVIRQFIESAMGSAVGANLFSKKSIGLFAEKMLMSVVESMQFTEHRDGLPTLQSLLAVLGPVGALCMNLGVTPILRGLRPLIDPLLGVVNLFLDAQIEVPVLTLAVVMQAKEEFARVPNANMFIPLSTSMLHWICLLAVLCFMHVSKGMSELAGVDFAPLKDMDPHIWISSEAQLSEVTQAAAKLIHDMSAISGKASSAPSEGPTSLFQGLTADAYNRMTYLIGCVHCTASSMENVIGKSVDPFAASFLRFPFSFIKLLVSFPMRPMPFRSTPNMLPEREEVLRKLAKEKTDIYSMQQASWLYGFAGLIFSLVNLPSKTGSGSTAPVTKVPFGELLSFMLGTLPQNLLLIWSLVKVVVVLEQESIMEAVPTAHTYRSLMLDDMVRATEGLTTLKTPYGVLHAQDIRATLGFLHKAALEGKDVRRVQVMLSEFTNGILYTPTASGAQLLKLCSKACQLELILPVSFVAYTKQRLLSMVSAFLGKCGIPLDPCHTISTNKDWAMLYNSILLQEPFAANQPAVIDERGIPTGLLSNKADVRGDCPSCSPSSLSADLPSHLLPGVLPTSSSSLSVPLSPIAAANYKPDNHVSGHPTGLSPLPPLLPMPLLPSVAKSTPTDPFALADRRSGLAINPMPLSLPQGSVSSLPTQSPYGQQSQIQSPYGQQSVSQSPYGQQSQIQSPYGGGLQPTALGLAQQLPPRQPNLLFMPGR